MTKIPLFAMPLVCLILTAEASASTITCGSPTREGTLTDAMSCATANGAPLSTALVGAAFGVGAPWTLEGNLNPSLTNGLLTIAFTSGTWNSTAVTGTWTISPSFWSTYTNAVIAFHVTEMGSNPDAWMFLITPGQTTGTFSYTRTSGNFGSFDDFELFGSATAVPDGGGTVALLGLAMGVLGLARRGASRSARRRRDPLQKQA